MDKAKFAKRLRELRRERGFRRMEDFAEEYNKIYGTYTPESPYGGILGALKNYENPKKPELPSLERLCNICSLLKCNPSYLLCEYDECKIYDDQFIHDATGLSDYSIQQLKHFNSDQFPAGKKIIALLNWFLQDPRFTHQLTNAVSKYCDKVLAYQKGKKAYHSERFVASRLTKGNIAAEIAMRESGIINPTISDQSLSALSDLKDIALLQAHQSFDSVLDCLVFHHCRKNGCDIDGTH